MMSFCPGCSLEIPEGARRGPLCDACIDVMWTFFYWPQKMTAEQTEHAERMRRDHDRDYVRGLFA